MQIPAGGEYSKQGVAIPCLEYSPPAGETDIYSQLYKINIIELTGMLSADEITRYTRQLLIEGWSEKIQEKLKNSTVFVAGAGGLGSPVLMYLTSAGIGNIIVCDFDSVELSNLNRQILHSDERIGMQKADSACMTLEKINPGINIIPIREKLTRKNAGNLIADADIIMDCLDNFDTRFILNNISVKNHIPLVHAGVSDFSGQITFLSPPETPCLECIFPKKTKKQKVPIAGSTAGVIGSLQATEAIKYLTGIGETLKNRLLFWDGAGMSFRIINLSRNPKCRMCRKLA